MSRRKRDAASYRGKTPEARAKQAANLRPGKGAEAGNELARRHGAYSRVDPDRVNRRVAPLVELLAEDPPLRAVDGTLPPHDRLVVELLARCLCRLSDVGEFLTLHGLLDPKTGQPRPAVAVEGELRREAFTLAEALGMSPASRGRLGLELASAGALLAGGDDVRDAAREFAGSLADPAVRSAARDLVRAAGAAREAGLDGPAADDPPPPVVAEEGD